MSWLLSHWSELGTLLGMVTTAVAEAKRRKAKKEAKRLATELDLIRASAGTKAKWEGDLNEQARAARAAKTPTR